MRTLFYVLRILEMIKRLFGPVLFWAGVFVAFILGILWAQNALAFSVGTVTDLGMADDWDEPGLYVNESQEDVILMAELYCSSAEPAMLQGCYADAYLDPDGESIYIAQMGFYSETYGLDTYQDTFTITVPAGQSVLFSYGITDASSEPTAVEFSVLEYVSPEAGGGEALSISTASQEVFNGMLLYFLSMLGILFVFRKRA